MPERGMTDQELLARELRRIAAEIRNGVAIARQAPPPPEAADEALVRASLDAAIRDAGLVEQAARVLLRGPA